MLHAARLRRKAPPPYRKYLGEIGVELLGSTCTVAKYLDVLSHELVRYDVATSARELKRGRENIYRIGLLMEALGRVRADVGNRTGDSDADKAALLMAMYGHFEKDFPPVKKVVKQLEAGTCKIK